MQISSVEITGGISWEFVCWKSKFPVWLRRFDWIGSYKVYSYKFHVFKLESSGTKLLKEINENTLL